jgi:hypothetical protein
VRYFPLELSIFNRKLDENVVELYSNVLQLNVDSLKSVAGSNRAQYESIKNLVNDNNVLYILLYAHRIIIIYRRMQIIPRLHRTISVVAVTMRFTSQTSVPSLNHDDAIRSQSDRNAKNVTNKSYPQYGN